MSTELLVPGSTNTCIMSNVNVDIDDSQNCFFSHNVNVIDKYIVLTAEY